MITSPMGEREGEQSTVRFLGPRLSNMGSETIRTTSMLAMSMMARTGIFNLREIDERESQRKIFGFFVLLFVLIKDENVYNIVDISMTLSIF